MPALPESIQHTFTQFKDVIYSRLGEFENTTGDYVFYEFCFCILTPQSSAENAWQVQNKLLANNFLQQKFDPTFLLADKNHYIRFHNQKAKRLLNAIDYYPKLKHILASNNNLFAIRQQIKNDFVGIGMKEASHFLRNIGYKNLAIIDRHILRNLVYCNVLQAPTPPKNEKQYLEIEQKMNTFANDIGIDMDVLDLLFFANSTGKVLK